MIAGHRPRSRALTAALALIVGLVVCMPQAASAAADVGYQDYAYAGTSSPNGTKRAESSLWFNDGSWWGNMWEPTSGDFHIFRLDPVTQIWRDTGTAVDTRSGTHADTLWDGQRLYIASHVHANTPASGHPTYLFRFSYDPLAKRYTREAGFPAQINNYSSKAVTIDKDSTGKLWATWMQGTQVYVNRSLGDDSTWGTPFVPPVTGTTVTNDELSSLVAFGGQNIGLMWSNQTSSGTGYRFAVHRDGQPDTTWEPSAQARSGAESADDHINLKADSSGRVYAAIKTSLNSASDPLTEVLVRGTDGSWSRAVAGTVAECPNRPMVLIDEEHDVLHLLQTGPSPTAFSCTTSGGTIYEKTAPLGALSFPAGRGTPIIQDGDSAAVHDVSSTKQIISAATGLAALAVNTSTSFYWHAYVDLGPPPQPTAPVASFVADVTSGRAPLEVKFTDTSTGGPTSWSWDFGDGATSTAQNPTHVYSTPGTYTVSLTAANSAGSDTETRAGYITVQPGRTFTAQADAYVRDSTPTKNFGTASGLRVKTASSGVYRSFVRFSVTGLTGTVTSAKVRLYATDGSVDGGSLRTVADTTWSQSTINWNNAPGFSANSLATAGRVASGTWVELDVTSYVSGNGDFSFALVNASPDVATYSSREGAQPPELVVMTQ